MERVTQQTQAGRNEENARRTPEMKRLTKRHLTSCAILPRLFECISVRGELLLLGYKRESAAVHHIMKKAPVVWSIALILLIKGRRLKA